MKPSRLLAVLLFSALVLVPGATASVAVTYTVTSGAAADNGWYLSDVTASIQATGATDTTYRWYVWPGFGARKASKYGKLLGGSTFVIGAGRGV